MAAKKVGALIKEARTKAGLTQEQLAKKVAGCSAADIGKAERGEKELTQEQLKAIAKATGVTQKSLLDAAKGASKPASSKPASSSSQLKLTAEEKKLIELYRKADDKTKKATAELLSEGAEPAGNVLTSLIGGSGSGNLLGSLLGGSGGSLIGTLLGSSSNQSQSSGSGNLLGSLLGGGSSGGNSGGSGSGDLLGSLLGGAASLLGGKRETPQDDGDK